MIGLLNAETQRSQRAVEELFGRRSAPHGLIPKKPPNFVRGLLWLIVGTFGLRLLSDVNVGVNVWRSTEVPHQRRPFDAPNIPYLIFLEIFLLVERHV